MHAMIHNTAADAPVDYRTDPSRYRHWRSASTDLSPRSRWTSSEDGGNPRRLQAQAQLVRSRRRHRVARRRAAHPLRASGGAHRRAHERQGSRVLFGRQHLHARAVQRMRGRSTSASSPTRRATASRIRAGTRASSSSRQSMASAQAVATSWRSPATRSCSSTTGRPPYRCRRCRCSACCPARAA